MVEMKGLEKQLPYELSLPYLRDQFWAVARKQGWAEKIGPAVVAVSGGSDSVALLWFFVQFWPGKVIVAHLEHGIRERSSIEDAAFVKKLAEAWGCEFEIEHVVVPRLLRKGESLEEGARRVRYDFFEQIAASEGATVVALGHTADDIAETLLFNLCRGSGPFGLVGIPEVRGQFIRPLSGWWREDLRRLLQARGICWREDPTNLDTTYVRNRIRHEIIPLLERTINSSTRQHFVDFAQDMQEFRRREEEQGELLVQWGKENVPFSMYGTTLSFVRSLSEQEQAWFIRAIGRKLSLKTLTRNRLTSLIATLKTSGRWLFQWENKAFICCGSGFMVWINPKLLYNTHAISKEIVFKGDRGVFLWGYWKVHWEKKQHFSGSLTSSTGRFQEAFPLELGSSLIVSPADSESSSLKNRKMKKIPWWLQKIWPVFSKSEKWQWIPFEGTFSDKAYHGGAQIILRLEPVASALEGVQ